MTKASKSNTPTLKFYETAKMPTTVTVKGQVTLPKSVRDAAGIQPGDRVTVRARAEGGVIVERQGQPGEESDFLRKLRSVVKRRPMRSGPFGGMTTEEVMRLLRGED